MSYLFWLALTYLVASFPFGLAVARACRGIDPRQAGSRNTGATNVARLCGARYGVLTLVLDLAKGFVPVAVAMTMTDSAFFPTLTALCALVGHMYSVFLYGQGGKGVATTIGVFLALAPGATLWSVLGCVLVIWRTGYVSAGSLTLVGLLPVVLLLAGEARFIPAALAALCLVVWKHRDNIARLVAGEEKPWRKAAEAA